MSVLRRRHRIVSFRVTQEEYEALQVACLAQGARSISEFARAAACAAPPPAGGSDGANLHDAFERFRARLEDLESQVRYLTGVFDAPRPASQDHRESRDSSTAKFEDAAARKIRAPWK